MANMGYALGQFPDVREGPVRAEPGAPRWPADLDAAIIIMAFSMNLLQGFE